MSLIGRDIVLIKNAWLNGGSVDLRVSEAIQEIGPHLTPAPGESVLDAGGGEVLPGLHDHHIHVFAAAAAYGSLDCDVGSGTVADCRDRLAQRLASARGSGWIRGVAYHEQQLGELDRWALDALCRDRPLRIQHRSGKLWVCNTLGLELLQLNASDQIAGVERDAQGRLNGRIVRNDTLIAQRLQATGGGEQPDVQGLSRLLAQLGIVGVTDTSAHNNQQSQKDFDRLRREGEILQRVELMGDDSLDSGYLKILLDGDRLPPLDDLVQRINAARTKGRNVAFHCVSHLELVFALAALADAANPEAGFDRIEHGSVVNDEMALRLASLGMPVITQPGFMYTKGDRYLTDLTGSELSDLYRFRGLQDRGVPVIASSDAPYGPVSPWQIISTAANRQTLDGVVVGHTERVSAEQALAGYLTPTSALNRPLSFAEAKHVVAGMPADLCILQGKWSEVRGKAENAMVRATLIGGSAAFDRGRSEP